MGLFIRLTIGVALVIVALVVLAFILKALILGALVAAVIVGVLLVVGFFRRLANRNAALVRRW